MFFLICNGVAAKKSIPLPSKSSIATDLIGRSLSEGTDDGYFSFDWKWKIEAGEIQKISILSKKVSDDYCSFVVLLVLKQNTSPTKYNATVQVDYTLNNNQWNLVAVQSKGIRVAATGKYLDCISTKIDDDGWSSINCLKINNNTDSALLVGGVIRSNESNEWHKFSTIIDGLKVVGIGGWDTQLWLYS